MLSPRLVCMFILYEFCMMMVDDRCVHIQLISMTHKNDKVEGFVVRVTSH